MGQLTAYSLNVALALLLLYLIYKWVLASQKMFSFNRFIILSIYAISLTYIPLYALFSSDNSIVSAKETGIINISSFEAISTTTNETSVWASIIVGVYILGATILLFRSMILWGKMTYIIKKGTKTKLGKYTLVLIDNNHISPFSWKKYIVINRNDYDNAYQVITEHEKKHLDCRHWIDMLLAEIITIFNWYNPAAWLLKEELKTVHEYQADMAVIDSGANIKEYQLLLIKKAVGARLPSFANSLNHSKLKKRITMMYSSESGKRSRLRALAIVPALALALTVFNTPIVASALSTVSSSQLSLSDDDDKGSKNVDTTQVKIFYVDGEKVETENINDFINNFPSEKIASMNVNKNGNIVEVHITTKKDGDKKTDGDKKQIKSQSSSISISREGGKSLGDIVILGMDKNGGSSIPDDAKVFVDGKVVSMDEFKKIPTEKIKSISINKQTGAPSEISVTLK